MQIHGFTFFFLTTTVLANHYGYYDNIIVLKSINFFINDLVSFGDKLSSFLLYCLKLKINFEFMGDYLYVYTCHVRHVPKEAALSFFEKVEKLFLVLAEILMPIQTMIPNSYNCCWSPYALPFMVETKQE